MRRPVCVCGARMDLQLVLSHMKDVPWAASASQGQAQKQASFVYYCNKEEQKG